MIENIRMATKAEISEEMEKLDAEFEKRKAELASKMDEWREYVKKEDAEMRELSKQYTQLKTEMDKREGKGTTK